MTINEYSISPFELNKLLQNKEKIQLIDVRTPEKHAIFNIGGKLIPFDELPNRLDELPQDQLIITYCTSGGRSMMALQFLLSKGFTLVKSLDGGVTAWQREIKD
ncbi:MAG: rhodanese-like domain-containing protein [Gammaproteobacteria bacterium]|nr:rhodanese-like domain-containing protein [Gammaproteobacteria bacterium]MCW5583132.1 rhodanese-like domain-containing protein [Gammaproteobacteria bacterium]